MITSEREARMFTVRLQVSNLLSVTSNAHCEYIAMTKTRLNRIENLELIRDNNGNHLLGGNEYMIIVCPNGHRYYVDVTADSELTACAETISFAARKL